MIIDSTYYSEFKSLDFVIYFKNKIRNSISVIENRTVSFCNMETDFGCILTYDKFAPLIGQNSKHFKAGDELVITAGIGSYSRASQPKVNIDKRDISVNDIGYAEFKKKISDKPGKYSIPLKINYYTPDGLSKQFTYQIEYFVDL